MALRSILSTIALACFAAPAFADFTGPLLVQFQGGGFVPPEWARSVECSIFVDKVVITQQFGYNSLSFTEERAIRTTNLHEAIEAAAHEQATSELAPCDVPANDLTAIRVLADGSTEEVVIRAAGGCSAPRVTRTGIASSVLSNFAYGVCGNVNSSN